MVHCRGGKLACYVFVDNPAFCGWLSNAQFLGKHFLRLGIVLVQKSLQLMVTDGNCNVGNYNVGNYIGIDIGNDIVNYARNDIGNDIVIYAGIDIGNNVRV